MQVKTSELTDLTLDYAVAVADGKANDVELHGGNVWYGRVTSGFVVWRPTMNWVQGGPIIEREKIQIVPDECFWEASFATYDEYASYEGHIHRTGPTPLIAAMRCYVASKLGDTVDIPEGLL